MFNSRQIASFGFRAFSTLRPPYQGKIPEGCLFAPLRREGKIMYSHHLDDESEYRRFLIEDLPFDVIEDVPTECQVAEHIVEVMQYNLPLFHPSWSFISELIYLKVVPKHKQTPEGLKKARILRGSFDVRYGGFAILDDIMDNSDKRRGKPTWKHISPKGIPGALCGGMLLNSMYYQILKKHFSDSPLYHRMMDTMFRADFQGMIGNVMDVYGQGGSERKLLDPAMQIATYKAGTLIGIQAVLGMQYAGIDDPALEKEVDAFETIVGEFFQVWDDFADYYNTSIETGKNSLDFVNGSTTWSSGTAMTLFDDKQKAIFYENYGTPDPKKHEIVRKLYDSVDLSGAYIKYFTKRSRSCYDMIKKMNHPGIQDALTSQLEWLVGELYLKN